MAGSPYYVAPEVIKCSYNIKCDIWAMGVLMYVMMNGHYPFQGKSDTELFESITNGNYQIDDHIRDIYSEDSLNFLGKLLTLNQKDRPSAAEAMEEPWLQTSIRNDSFNFSAPKINIVKSLR